MQNTPHKKPRSSSKKPKQSKQPHIPTKLIVVLTAIATIIVMIIGAVAINSFKDNQHAKEGVQKMQTYLQDKYKKEFVVKNYRIEGAGLGVEGDPKADAYPKDDSSLSFIVTDAGAYKFGKHSYWDTYPEKIWEREFRKELQGVLVGTFDKGVNLQSVKISVALSALYDMRGDIPHYKTVFRKYGKDVYVSVRIESDKAYGKLPERLYKTIHILKEPGVSLRLGYVDMKHRVWMGVSETDSVVSSEDISKHIEEV